MISAKAVAGEPILGYLNSTGMVSQEIYSGMKMTEMYYDVTAYVRPYDSTKYVLVLGNIADAAAETRSILSVSGIKLANHITPATSTQIAADIASLVTLAYQPVEEPVFTPERFELRYSGRRMPVGSQESALKHPRMLTMSAFTGLRTTVHLFPYARTCAR